MLLDIYIFLLNLFISLETAFPMRQLKVNIIHNQMMVRLLKMQFPHTEHSLLLRSPHEKFFKLAPAPLRKLEM